MRKINGYDLSPIFIIFLFVPNDLMGVPFAAVSRTRDECRFEVDVEGGQRLTCDPVSSRHLRRVMASMMVPRCAGRGVVIRAALGDRLSSFPTRLLANLHHPKLPRYRKPVLVAPGNVPRSNDCIPERISRPNHRTFCEMNTM